MLRTFPLTINVGDQCSVVLNADGTHEGDAAKLRAALEAMVTEDEGSVLAWLVLREMLRDQAKK